MLAALLLATVAPAQAHPIRYELVFETAKRVCPRFETIVHRDPREVAAQISYLGTKLRFTHHEEVVLVHHCYLYSEGTQR